MIQNSGLSISPFRIQMIDDYKLSPCEQRRAKNTYPGPCSLACGLKYKGKVSEPKQCTDTLSSIILVLKKRSLNRFEYEHLHGICNCVSACVLNTLMMYFFLIHTPRYPDLSRFRTFNTSHQHLSRQEEHIQKYFWACYLSTS